MTTFFLIRHGVTDVVATTLCGQLGGIPLNELGRRQARAMVPRLSGLDAVISSPIDRTMETAAILADAFGLRPIVDAGLSEFDFGEWSGLTFEKLDADPRWREFNRNRQTARAPGGESMADVQVRALASLSKAEQRFPGKTIAMVTHSAVIRLILTDAAKTAVRHYNRFTIDPASISVVERFKQGETRIARSNDCAHLENDAL